MTHQQLSQRLSPNTWLLPIIMVAFAARLYRLDTQSLWFDEIITVALARLPWYEGLVGLLGQGIQLTPLFHGLVKLSLIGDDSDWWLRFPAAAVSVLSAPMIFKVGRYYFDKKVGLLAALIFAVNPYQVWYGQELRLYALLPLTAGGAMIAFSQLARTNGRRGMKPLIFFNSLGFAAHYFAFMIPLVQFFHILAVFRRTPRLLRRWTLAQALAVLPLVPWWGFIIWRQHFAVGIGWVPRPDWYTLLLTFWNFSFAYTGQVSIVTALAVIVMLVGLGQGLRRTWSQTEWRGLLLPWLFFPPLLTGLLSFRTISFYVDRYLLLIAPILTVLVAAGLLSLRPPVLRGGMTLIFLLGTGLGLWQIYFDRDNFSKEDWRTITQVIEARARPEDVVITCTDGHWLAYEYYNSHQTIAADQVFFAAQVDEATGANDRVWIVDVHKGLSMHHLAKTKPPVLDKTLLSPELAAWEAAHRQAEITASGLTAYLYETPQPNQLAKVVAWYCRD